MKFLQPPVLPSLSADPASPVAGTLYVNSTSGFKWYNTAWSTAMDLESTQTASGTKTFGTTTTTTANITTLNLTNAIAQAKTHASPDTDSATTALHHTLGTGANQAAAGNHTHDASGIVSGILPIARGGNNSTATPTAGAVAYGSGTAYAFTAAGAATQALVSNGAAAPSWATLDLSYLPGSWVKKSVRVATTANITLSGTQTIDGVTVAVGDRVLVKNQTTASQNGIYVVASGAWTRSTDANTSANIAGGTLNVDTGATNAGIMWTTNFKPTDTLDTTAMTWAQVIDSGSTQTITGDKTFSGNLNFTGGSITSNPIWTPNVNKWTDITSLLVAPFTAYTSSPSYRAGVQYRVTHDNMVILSFSVQTATATSANPNLISSYPVAIAPKYVEWGMARSGTSSGNAALPIAITPTTVQLLAAAATYNILSGTITYPLD